MPCAPPPPPGGALLANHTAVAGYVAGTAQALEGLLRRRHLVNWFTGEGMEEAELWAAQETLLDIAARYRDAEASAPSPPGG